jgi:hypothetical protein
MVAAVEKALAVSVPAKTLNTVSETLEAARGLLALAEGVHGPVAVAATELLPVIRSVAKLADEADAPIPVCARLDAAVAALVDEHAAEVEPNCFTCLADAAREVVQALDLANGNAELALEGKLARQEAQARGPLVQPFLVEVRVLGSPRAARAG